MRAHINFPAVIVFFPFSSRNSPSYIFLVFRFDFLFSLCFFRGVKVFPIISNKEIGAALVILNFTKIFFDFSLHVHLLHFNYTNKIHTFIYSNLHACLASTFLHKILSILHFIIPVKFYSARLLHFIIILFFRISIFCPLHLLYN